MYCRICQKPLLPLRAWQAHTAIQTSWKSRIIRIVAHFFSVWITIVLQSTRSEIRDSLMPPRNKQIRVIWILNLQGTCWYCLIKLIMYLILRDGVSCQPVEATQQKSAQVTVLSVFWSQQRMVSCASRFLCGFERSFQGNYSKTLECWRVTANYKRWSI